MKKCGILKARRQWLRQKSNEQAFSLQQMILYDKSQKKFIYRIETLVVCARSFKVVLAIGAERIQRAKDHLGRNPVLPTPVGQQQRPTALLVQDWLKTFFNLHCDIMPDRDRRLLPAHFTKLEVYKLLAGDESMKAENDICSFSHFGKIWNDKFPNVCIPKTNRFSMCSQCEHFKTLRKDGIHREDKGLNNYFESYMIIVFIIYIVCSY